MNLTLINTALNKIIPAFGWMLIHSLWEGLFFAIIAGAVLMLAKRSIAAYRYNLILVLFAAFIISCVFTFVYEWNIAASTAIKLSIPGNKGFMVPALFLGNAHGLKQFVKIFTAYFEANEPLLVLAWFVFFLFKSVKMLACLFYNQQIRVRQVAAAPALWIEKITVYSEKLQIKRAVNLLQSGYIKVPVVVGHLKPLILMPVGLLAGLPVAQVEAILLHELAHIRRNDYFVNFLQNMAEAVFFFNPGLLWISSLLREERENCCDDIALSQTKNKTDFVQALISFKEHELYGSAYTVAFPGKKNYLLRRVNRIISNKNMSFGFGEKIFFIASILLLSALITAASAGQIKEYSKSAFGRNLAVATRIESINRKKENIAKKIKTVEAIGAQMSRAQAKARAKMVNGISGIKKKTEPQTVIPSKAGLAPSIVNNQHATAPDRTDVVAKAGRVRKDQEQAKLDQLQAMSDQYQAAKDQAQAMSDQAQALKDQALATKNAQVQKDENKLQKNERVGQAARNAEQVRLNQVQEKKNQEQVVRNQQQVRLNQIQQEKNQEQAIRNQEQAARNQEQAWLNQIQAAKNQQQAMKNKVRVQK